MLKLKKKVKRALQEIFGREAKVILFPPDFSGKNWSELTEAFAQVKPSQRLRYYKDFRLFLKEIKFETVYKAPGDDGEQGVAMGVQGKQKTWIVGIAPAICKYMDDVEGRAWDYQDVLRRGCSFATTYDPKDYIIGSSDKFIVVSEGFDAWRKLTETQVVLELWSWSDEGERVKTYPKVKWTIERTGTKVVIKFTAMDESIRGKLTAVVDDVRIESCFSPEIALEPDTIYIPGLDSHLDSVPAEYEFDTTAKAKEYYDKFKRALTKIFPMNTWVWGYISKTGGAGRVE